VCGGNWGSKLRFHNPLYAQIDDDLLTSIGQLGQRGHPSIDPIVSERSWNSLPFPLACNLHQLRILFYTEAIRLTFSNTASSTCSSTMRIQFPTRDCAKTYLAVTRKTVAPNMLSRLIWDLQTCHYDFFGPHLPFLRRYYNSIGPLSLAYSHLGREYVNKMSINFRNSTAHWM
jgi:hypothetical protein